jgi:hypothetical protein
LRALIDFEQAESLFHLLLDFRIEEGDSVAPADAESPSLHPLIAFM